jgi:serine/threonine protein kinase/Tol biopolymer transport system component
VSTQTDRLNAALAGRYTIERELGAGGMATVYLAHDVKHDRHVALKVLKPELAAVLGAERFVVEIKTTAALQHPHILPLFDSGTADSFLFYVMPWIEGETLRDKLNREKQLGVDEAVRITREVADALDYAHRHGVIHRDIKPENILLHDGRPMVADFGIALALSAAAGGRMTETGLSLGTPHYMSPEQATAEKEITARSDVYSLGSVLYEMLTGNPPHVGVSAQQIIMKIITEPAAPVTQFRKAVPPNVAAAVAKSLEKLPADRFESARAFSEALGNQAFRTQTEGGAWAPSDGSRRQRALVPAVALGALALGFILANAWRPAQTSRNAARFVLSAPPSAPLNPTANSIDVAISPDGKLVAYISGPAHGLYVRAVDSLNGTMLAGSDGAASPVFSPDGKSIAFFSGGQLRKVPARGGPIVPLAPVGLVEGLSWGTNDTIVAGVYTGNLLAVPAGGGTAIELTRADTTAGNGRIIHRWPEVLPGNRGVIFTTKDIVGGPFHLAVLDRRTGKVRMLDQVGSSPRWSPTGHVIYSAEGALWALPFDPVRLEATGAPVLVLPGVSAKGLGASTFSIARDEGSLVFSTANVEVRSIAWIDSVGRSASLEGAPPNNYRDPRFSPDGNVLALVSGDHIFTYDIRRATLTQLTRDSVANYTPVWTPDGRNIVYTTNRGGGHQLYMRRADGSGTDQPLAKAPPDHFDLRANAFTRDGARLLITHVPPTVHCWISVLTIKDGKVTDSADLVKNTGCNDFPALSPDERWVAYAADAAVMVERFPEGGMRQQLSDGEGRFPMWSRDGRTVYYEAGDSAMAVPVRSGATLELSRPRLLFRAPILLTSAGVRPLNIGPDGRFAAVLTGAMQAGGSAGAAANAVPPSIVLVQDWTSELRRMFAKK